MYELNVMFCDSPEARFEVTKADLNHFSRAVEVSYTWVQFVNQKTGRTYCLKPNDVKMFNYKEIVKTED